MFTHIAPPHKTTRTSPEVSLVMSIQPKNWIWRPPGSAFHANTHIVQFFSNPVWMARQASQFLCEGITSDRVAVVTVTAENRGMIQGGLRDHGLDPERLNSSGQLIFLETEKVLAEISDGDGLSQERFLELYDAHLWAAAEMSRGVCVYTDLVGLLCAQAKHSMALELEGFWHELVERLPISMLCGYRLSDFQDRDFQGYLQSVCDLHPVIYPEENFSYDQPEDEQARQIVMLQQQAHLLTRELQERSRREAELEEANLRLKRAVNARDDFLTVAAHELKTPITSLRAFAQLLARDVKRGHVKPDRLALALDVIDAQTIKLNQLMSRLLDTTQITDGRLAIDCQQVDLLELVTGTTRLFTPAERARFRIIDDSPVLVAVDPVRMEQVVTNLLTNALKFSPASEAIEISVTAHSSIVLSVTDHGVGVPEEFRDVIFDRFVEAKRDRHLTGLGLGLFIVREIVELHGGAVSYEVPPHPGARFVVTLPPSRLSA